MNRRGLTLVELVVVLLILVLVASVALRSTEGLVQQARYDTTARTLSNVEEAILGPRNAREPDGRVRLGGFVADLGRLPQVPAGVTDPTLQLSELWQKPPTVEAFALRASDLDADVVIGSGWRGPYLRLPPGAASVRDGWGRGLSLLRTDGVTNAGPGDEIGVLRSLGADNTAGGAAFDADQQIDLRSTAASVDRVNTTIAGTVILAGAGGPPVLADGDTLIVVLYAPDPTGAETDEVIEDPVTVTITATTTTVPFSFPSTAGPRVLRAYQRNGLTLATLRDDDANTRMSDVRLLHVPAGGQPLSLVLH